jgi:hypothetical protein
MEVGKEMKIEFRYKETDEKVKDEVDDFVVRKDGTVLEVKWEELFTAALEERLDIYAVITT